MSIDIMYDKRIDTKRLAPSDESGDDTEEYEVYLSKVKAHIQVLEDSFTEDVAGNFGKDSAMYCEIVDIKEGDIVVDGTKEYKVVAVKKMEFYTADDHMELKIRESIDG